MKKTIIDFETKYEVQDDLLTGNALEGLDVRTLHETIKAMLINTVKDCIKYETWMDPDMAEISNFLVKENKTEDEMRKIKVVQNRLRESLHFARISENSLNTLLYQMLSTDDIKQAFKQDIPAMCENLYYLVDMENEISESLTLYFEELYNAPSYKEMCLAINNTIEDFIENAEEYFDDIKEHDYYDQFVSFREQRKNRKEKQESANE